MAGDPLRRHIAHELNKSATVIAVAMNNGQTRAGAIRWRDAAHEQRRIAILQ
jgi:hypothetical protein